MRLVILLAFIFSFSVMAETPDDRLGGVDGHAFDPSNNMTLCGVHTEIIPGTRSIEAEITGGECLQAGAISELECGERALVCSGKITYMGCKDRYGHRFGKDCLDENGGPMLMSEVEADARIRIYTGAKKIALTIHNRFVEGLRVNEAAQIFVLKKRTNP